MPTMTPQQVTAECQRLAGRGLHAAARMFANLVRQQLSVAAPRRIAVTGSKSRTPGIRHHVATTKATPGAPPRKLTGRLRSSIAVDFNQTANVARVGTNVVYARRHELGVHPFLVPTLRMYQGRLALIVGQNMNTGAST